MKKTEIFMKQHYYLAAVLLTLTGYLSLRIGGLSVQSLPPDIGDIASYIIPFIFLIGVKYIFNIRDNEGLVKVYDSKKPQRAKRFIIVTIIGIAALIIPLFLSLTSDIAVLAGKKLAENAGIILIQITLLNLCIGLFEEGLFRNLMMKILLVDNEKKTYIKAFFITSLLFGIIHLGNLSMAMGRPVAIISQVIYAVFMGMLMAGLYLKFGSFSAIVFLHALFDFISMIPKLYGMNADIATNAIPDLTLMQGFNTVITMVPTAVVGLLLLRSFLRKNLNK